MVLRRGQAPGRELVEETAEIARNSSRGGFLTMLVSAFALIFSGVSLYQTVIKQAQLHLFVPDAISYTRDPDGAFEVFVVPITVSNSGARDGVVSSIGLEVRNMDTGVAKTLEASYFASPGYFSTKVDVSKNIRRPKAPFAPISIAGRGSATSTVLFYARQNREAKVVPGKGRYQLRLTAKAKPTQSLGILDQFWTTDIAPQEFVFDLPKVSPYFVGRMFTGHSVRMFRTD